MNETSLVVLEMKCFFFLFRDKNENVKFYLKFETISKLSRLRMQQIKFACNNKMARKNCVKKIFTIEFYFLVISDT